jgi:hypothetical protein
MSNPLLLSMLKSMIGPEQIEGLEKLTSELVRALAVIHDMDARLKRLEVYYLNDNPPAPPAPAETQTELFSNG